MWKLSIIVVLVGFLAIPFHVLGQYSAVVRRASAETTDGLLFSVWTDHQTVIDGNEIMLHYKVYNRSSSPIYLVRRDAPEFDSEGGRILVQSPVPVPVGHGDYDYNFLKIGRGKSYQGQIVIPKKAYHSLDTWPIDVGFGYVLDVTALNRRLRPSEDPAVLRGALNSRIKVVGVGTLSVKIVDR